MNTNTKFEVVPGAWEWLIYRNDEYLTAISIDTEEFVNNEAIKNYAEMLIDNFEDIQVDNMIVELLDETELMQLKAELEKTLVYYYGYENVA